MPIRFLALGDSYTIGESVEATERWPVQLATMLRESGFDVDEPEIIARAGWTTDDLEAAISTADPRGAYGLVSLLIGVNNQYRGRPLDEYRTEFRALLGRAIGFASGVPGRVLVLSIPDWGVTPFGEGRERTRIGAEIDAFNAVNRTETECAGACYVDISQISRRAANQPSLTAADGLHPSGELYRGWAMAVLEHARAALTR